MKIAVIASNKLRITQNVGAGPEIFVYSFIKNFVKKKDGFEMTAFSSGDSDLPVPIESINKLSSIEDENIGEEWHKLYEFMLLSKAFSQQNNFDAYHINIGNGEVVFPFLNFVSKPIIITLHSSLYDSKGKKYLSMFSKNRNVFFVSISQYQKNLIKDLNYIDNIYHGIDTTEFEFSQTANEEAFWIGRGIPEKGLDVAFETLKYLKKPGVFFISLRQNHQDWVNNILSQKNGNSQVQYNTARGDVIEQYKKSKMLLFPIRWEEPFGLVMIESMACGTPVVAFARGSVPEIIKDGETGYIVNPSDNDIRGNWIVKKTGLEGFKEAVARIYSLSQDDYLKMRFACRNHIETGFSINTMIEKYKNVYQKIINRNH